MVELNTEGLGQQEALGLRSIRGRQGTAIVGSLSSSCSFCCLATWQRAGARALWLTADFQMSASAARSVGLRRQPVVDSTDIRGGNTGNAGNLCSSCSSPGIKVGIKPLASGYERFGLLLDQSSSLLILCMFYAR